MSDPAPPVMLVAGGTGSIGRAIAAQALAAGWQVVVQGQSVASADATRTALNGDEDVLGLTADIAEPGAATELTAAAAAWRGRLDSVVDCVSTGPAARVTGPFGDSEPAGFAPLLALSLGWVEALAHAALPRLRAQGGTFIAFASDAGRFAAPRQTLIGASRAGIIGFVRNLAMECARDGVRAHCICPSFVDETTSARRLAEASAERMEQARRRAGLGLPTPDDIAPLVLFLCGDGARRITGQVISVNGGLNA